MTSSAIDRYVALLECELTRRGTMNRRLIDEAREHLRDAIQVGVERGLPIETAEHEAFIRFGAPETVAAAIDAGRNPMNRSMRTFLMRFANMFHRRHEHGAQYHDVATPSAWHFALRLKRRWRFRAMSAEERQAWVSQRRERGEDVSAFETDPRERLVQFLRDFSRRTCNADDSLESLVLLEDKTGRGKRGGKYLVRFTNGTQMVWTVVLTDDGGVTFDGITAQA